MKGRPKKYFTDEERRIASLKAANKYRHANVEKIVAQRAKSYVANKVAVAEVNSAYYYANKEYYQEWHRQNRARIKALKSSKNNC